MDGVQFIRCVNAIIQGYHDFVEQHLGSNFNTIEIFARNRMVNLHLLAFGGAIDLQGAEREYRKMLRRYEQFEGVALTEPFVVKTKVSSTYPRTP